MRPDHCCFNHLSVNIHYQETTSLNTIAPPTGGGGASAAATVVVVAHPRAGCVHPPSELLLSHPLGMMTLIHVLLMVMLSLLAWPVNEACYAQLMRPGLHRDDHISHGDSNGNGTLLPHGAIDDKATSHADVPPPGTMITSQNGASNVATTMMTGTNNAMGMFLDLPHGNGNRQHGGSSGNSNGSLNSYNR